MKLQQLLATFIVALGLWGPTFSNAQSTRDWIPVYLPPNDGFVPDDQTNWFVPTGTNEPAGAHGFLTVDGEGHFRFEDGTPVRFVGVNLTAGAAFPDSTEAQMMARRLAKFGINLVRLHHLDNAGSNRESLIQPGADSRQLDPAQFDRLDYLIHQLGRNGIYICISLNSARRFRSGDGVARADSIPPNGKAVSLFEPRLLFLQKEHATNLLSHNNPYTGLRYADDPRIAMLEISNENSLYAAWKRDLLNGRRVYNSGLSYFHQKMLDSLWNDFLSAKYGATEALRHAWGATDQAQENLLRNGDFEAPFQSEWILEQHGAARARFSRTSTSESGSYAALVEVQIATNSISDLQLKQVGMPIEQDSTYALIFSMRSNFPHAIRVALVRDDMPDENLGLDKVVLLQNGFVWQSFALHFTAAKSNLENARLTFAFSDRPDEIYFDNMRLQQTHRNGLLITETLEARNIRRLEHRERLNFSPARVQDTAEFYEFTQHRFFSEMCRHLKEQIGARMLVTANNIYAGPADVQSTAVADYIDHHAYWDHPQYPNGLFSRNDWRISNLPMARQPLLPGGTIAALASQAVAGKPFSVSEYNHPFPNQYQAEAIPFLVAYGSLQDWDALLIYSYHQGFENWLPQVVADHFQIDGNPLMMALLPQFSQIFRQRLIQRAQRQILLEYTRDEVYRYDAGVTGLLGVEGALPETVALVHRLGIGSFNASAPRDAGSYGVSPPISPYRSDTGEIEWDDRAGLLTVETPHAVVVSGFLDEQSILLDKMRVLGASSFGTILWTATQPLTACEKSLLSIVTRVENSSQNWYNNDHTQSGWGNAPALMEPQKLFLEFHLPVDSIWVFPLDSLGRAARFRSYQPDQNGLLRVYINQSETKSLWFGIRHFNKTTSVDHMPSEQPKTFSLSQSFPNPVYAGAGGHGSRDGGVQIRYTLSHDAEATLILYDIRGREVKRLVANRQQAGEYKVSFATSGLPSGLYFYRLQSGKQQAVRKLVVIK